MAAALEKAANPSKHVRQGLGKGFNAADLATAGERNRPLSKATPSGPRVVSADDIMPRLCFVVTHAWGELSQPEDCDPLSTAAPSSARPWERYALPFAQLSYMEEGMPGELLNGEEGYLLTSLRGALMYAVSLGTSSPAAETVGGEQPSCNLSLTFKDLEQRGEAAHRFSVQ